MTTKAKAEVRIFVRVPGSVKSKLFKVAKREKISVAEVVRRIIKAYIG